MNSYAIWDFAGQGTSVNQDFCLGLAFFLSMGNLFLLMV
jgi:hypothetical protein